MKATSIKKLVISIAVKLKRKYPNLSITFEDLVSAGYLGYSQALKSYNKNRRGKTGKKATLATYSFHRIRGEMLDEIRRQFGDERRHKKLPKIISTENIMLSDNGFSHSLMESRLELEILYSKTGLTDFEKYLLKLKIYGYTEEEIAIKIKRSGTYVHYRMCEIKDKLEPYLK